MERIVIIKTWDRMVKEFGLDHRNVIPVLYSFNKDMEKELPPHRTIKIKKLHNVWKWFLSNRSHFTISESMIASEIKRSK